MSLPHLPQIPSESGANAGSAVSELNEMAQGQQWKAGFEDGGSEGPPHLPVFKIYAVVTNKEDKEVIRVEGIGTSQRFAPKRSQETRPPPDTCCFSFCR